MVDQCGTCGSPRHLTKDCKATNPSTFMCKVCDRHGHATWAKDCPAYRAEVAALMRRNPDLQHRFFPTPDPASWPRAEPQRPNMQADDPSGLATQWSLDQQIDDQGGWTTVGRRPSQKQRTDAARAARTNGAPSLTQLTLTGTNSEPLGIRASNVHAWTA